MEGLKVSSDRHVDSQHTEAARTTTGSTAWGYRFSDLLAFAALTEPLEPTFALPFPASTGAIRPVLSLSASRRALCVALRWLARRFIFFALFVPRIGERRVYRRPLFAGARREAAAPRSGGKLFLVIAHSADLIARLRVEGPLLQGLI